MVHLYHKRIELRLDLHSLAVYFIQLLHLQWKKNIFDQKDVSCALCHKNLSYWLRIYSKKNLHKRCVFVVCCPRFLNLMNKLSILKVKGIQDKMIPINPYILVALVISYNVSSASMMINQGFCTLPFKRVGSVRLL